MMRSHAIFRRGRTGDGDQGAEWRSRPLAPHDHSGGFFRATAVNTLVASLVIAAFIVATVAQGHCASRFADGFRGVAWGTHKDNLPDLGITDKAMKGIYESGPSTVFFMEGKGNLDMHLDDVPLLSIFMRFNDRVFYGFDMVFSEENAPKVRLIMEREMQSPGEETDDGLKWEQDGLTVVVTDRELMVSKK